MTHQLVYTSCSNITDDEEINSIVNKAILKNATLNITGVLAFRSGLFLQLLEGDKEKVFSLFEKIKKDPRHSNVTVILERDSGAGPRLFKNWSMAFRNVTPEEVQTVDSVLSWVEMFVPEEMKEDLILFMLREFQKGF